MSFPIVFKMSPGSMKTTVPLQVKDDGERLPPLISANYGGKAAKKKWQDVEDLDPKVAVYAVEAFRIFIRKSLAARRMADEARRAYEAAAPAAEKDVAPLKAELASLESKLSGKKQDPDAKRQAAELKAQLAAKEAPLVAAAGTLASNIRAFIASKRDVDGIIEEGGASLEKAHRQYLGYEKLHRRFTLLREEAVAIDRRLASLRKGVVEEVARKAGGKVDLAVKTEAARRQKSLLHSGVDLAGVSQEELSFILPKGADPAALARELAKAPKSDGINAILSSSDVESLRAERDRRLRDSERLWRDPMVQYLEQQATVREFVAALEKGEEVLELPYTVGKLNELREIEDRNPNTTVGAVVVGDPGTGKTTAVRYYLAKSGRQFSYMDLSKELTRFQTLGSKDVSLESPLADLQRVVEAIDKAPEEQVAMLLESGVKRYGASFAVMVEEAAGGKDGESGKAGDKKAVIKRVLERRMADVMADEVYKAGKRNGWRYGFIIDALKRNVCPILDEFNKAQNVDWLWGLMTAQPASDREAGPMPGTDEESVKANPKGWYYFADNNEWIRVQEDWRMYFTGNIGSVHQVYNVPPALRSRMEGKVVHFDYPPLREEMMAMHAMICDPDSEFRAPYGVAEGLRILLSEVFPKLRAKKASEMPQPVSLRTTAGIANQLYDRSTETSRAEGLPDFDRAILVTLLNPYKLQEKPSMPRVIVEMCNNVGLLLSPEVEEDVVDFICENPADRAQRDEAKKTLKAKREEHEKGGVLPKLRDQARFSAQRAFQAPPGLGAV